jgi:hypothetical protein
MKADLEMKRRIDKSNLGSISICFVTFKVFVQNLFIYVLREGKKKC